MTLLSRGLQTGGLAPLGGTQVIPGGGRQTLAKRSIMLITVLCFKMKNNSGNKPLCNGPSLTSFVIYILAGSMCQMEETANIIQNPHPHF